jgi:hypothetical protein
MQSEKTFYSTLSPKMADGEIPCTPKRHAGARGALGRAPLPLGGVQRRRAERGQDSFQR